MSSSITPEIELTVPDEGTSEPWDVGDYIENMVKIDTFATETREAIEGLSPTAAPTLYYHANLAAVVAEAAENGSISTIPGSGGGTGIQNPSLQFSRVAAAWVLSTQTLVFDTKANLDTWRTANAGTYERSGFHRYFDEATDREYLAVGGSLVPTTFIVVANGAGAPSSMVTGQVWAEKVS